MISKLTASVDLVRTWLPLPLLAASGGGGGGSSAGGIRAGAAFVELFAKDNMLLRAFDRARDRTLKLAGYMRTGGAAVAGASAGILGAVGGIFAGVVSRNVEAGRMARRFGDSVENFTALQYAAEKTGVPIEQLGDVLENLPERIDDAVQGGGEAAEVFKRMGIDARGFMALPLTDRFARLADGLSGFNDVQKASILGKLFSDKGQMLGEMFAGGSKGFKSLLAEAGTMGAITSKEQEQQSKEVSDAWFMASTAVKTAVFEVGAALLPQAGVVKQVAQGIVAGASAIRQWLSENKQAVQTTLLVVAAVGALGAAFAVAGVAVSALLSPVGLFTTAVGGLGTLFVTQTDAGAEFAEKTKAYFQETAAVATEAWGGIEAAMKKGDLATAGKIALAGLNVEFRRGVLLLTQAWNSFKGFFVDGWHDAVMLVELAWNDAVGVIGEAFFEIFRFLQKNFGDFLSAIWKQVGAAGKALGIQELQDAARVYEVAFKDGKLIDAAQKMFRSDNQAASFGITNQAQRDQSARDAARKGDANTAKAELDAAKAALAALVTAAKEPLLKAPPRAEATKDELRKSVASAVQGAFAGSSGNLSLVFGRGTPTILQQQLSTQRQTERNTAATAEAVKENRASVFL